jgi:flagellar basal-body rod protein FlgB
MFEKLELTAMAQAMAAHAGARMGVISRNVAQADNPGYKARDLPDFGKVWAQTKPGAAMRATRPGHLHGTQAAAELTSRISAGSASPNGNTVSLENEMVKAVEVRQQHDMALAIYRSTSDVIRTSLGRA